MDKAEKVFNSLIKEASAGSLVAGAGYAGSAYLGNRAKKKDKSNLLAATGVGAAGSGVGTYLNIKKNKKAIEEAYRPFLDSKTLAKSLRRAPLVGAGIGALGGAAAYGLGRAFTSKND